MIKPMKNQFVARSKQSGTFAVEFAVLAIVVLVALIGFAGDAVMRLSIHGKLDRLAYSSVSVIRERTALFSGVDMTASDSAQFNDLLVITQNSFQRVMGSYSADKFGMVLEVLTFDDEAVAQPLITFTDSVDSNCQVGSALSPVITDSATTLYRVTLCYEADNWFGGIMGKDYGLVSSNALSVGR